MSIIAPIGLRRRRLTAATRALLGRVHFGVENLIQPYFVYQDLKECSDLPGLHLQKKHNTHSLLQHIAEGLKSGIRSILLFPVPAQKREGDFDYSFECQQVEQIKREFGDDVVCMVDLCLCSQTLSGHCGVVDVESREKVLNRESVQELVKKGVALARSGADVLGPSDMMDDRILALRGQLDRQNLQSTLIMSYSSKFSSAFYGPFRNAANSAPSDFDRKSYQIDPTHPHDALSCSLRDWKQGADILMVKPAGAYLDIIHRIAHHPKLNLAPLAAYQVSGEYQSLYLLQQAQLGDFWSLYRESLTAIFRSGAQMVITYGANSYAQKISRGELS